MHEFESKGVAKWAPHKRMKRKGRFFEGRGWGEFQNGNGAKGSRKEEGGRRKEEFGGDVVDHSQPMLP